MTIEQKIVDDYSGDEIKSPSDMVEVTTFNHGTGDTVVSHLSQKSFNEIVEDDDLASIFIHD